MYKNSVRTKVKQSTSTQLVNHTVSPKPRMWPVWLSDFVSWIREEWRSFISFCCRTERVGDYQRCPDLSWIWISFNVYMARVERIVFFVPFMALLDTVQKASMGSLNSGTHWLLCQCSTHLQYINRVSSSCLSWWTTSWQLRGQCRIYMRWKLDNLQVTLRFLRSASQATWTENLEQ